MQQSAMDVLSDLLLRYIGEIGSTTRSYSELGHRMTPTSEDLVLAVMRPLLSSVRCQTHSRRQWSSTIPLVTTIDEPQGGDTMCFSAIFRHCAVDGIQGAGHQGRGHRGVHQRAGGEHSAGLPPATSEPGLNCGSALEHQTRTCTLVVLLVQEEVPFAHTLPPYPVQRTPKWPPTFEQRKEVSGWTSAGITLLSEPHRLCMPLTQSAPGSPPQLTLQCDPHLQAPPQHIPAWLPALPDKHTYQATPSFAGHDTDAKRQRIAATKAKRQVLLTWLAHRARQCQAQHLPHGLLKQLMLQSKASMHLTSASQPSQSTCTWRRHNNQLCACSPHRLRSRWCS